MSTNQDIGKKNRIFSTLNNLNQLPKVSIRRINDVDEFHIEHTQQFVPDFRFIWCKVKQHYRVYIFVGANNREKKNAGYTICTINSGFAAAGFCVLYGFIHKHRANNKE